MADVGQSLNDWRRERFLELGFDLNTAFRLAQSRDDEGWPISYSYCERLLGMGCPHDVLVRIVE